MKKRVTCLGLVMIMLLSLVGCGDNNNQDGEYQIYYINMELTKISSEGYDSSGATGETLVKELLEQLKTKPSSSKLRQAIPTDVVINGVKTDGNYLTVDFSDTYKNMAVTEETLIRAAIVRTLVQVPEYSLISFTVNSEPLRTKDGTLVGNMTAESFVENPGEQINASTQSTIKLYFSSADGKNLVEETRVVTHSSSISMEKLVVEQLIAGPQKSKSLSTIPSSTKIINVTVVNGTCYVNLDNSFQNQNKEIREEIVLYSLVNSLTELPTVTKVQLSINGSTKGYCRYTYELSKMYEKNLSLLENRKTEE